MKNTTENIEKYLDKFLQNKERIEFRQQLDQIYKKTIEKKHNRIATQYKKILKIAAFFIVIIGIGTLIFMLSSSSTNIEIYNKYAYNESFQPNIIRDADSIKNIDLAINYYKKKKYKKAIIYFDKCIENKFIISDAEYICLAISHTEENNFEKAEFYLKKVIKNNPLLSQQAEWYLGLLYLKSDNTKKAKSVFKTISKNKNHYKNKNAIEILEYF